MKKECKFCYKKFVVKKDEDCCCDYCESKYNNYLANSDSEKPWDKLVN